MDSNNNKSASPSTGDRKSSQGNFGNQRRNNYSKYNRRKRTNPRPLETEDNSKATDSLNASNDRKSANVQGFAANENTSNNSKNNNSRNTRNVNSRNISPNVKDNSQNSKSGSNTNNRRDNSTQTNVSQQVRQQSKSSGFSTSADRNRKRWDPEKIKIEETYEDIKKENERIEKEIWLEIASIHNTRLD